MEDENPIRTLEDYSKPSHKGNSNTIEHSQGNNVVPLQSETICTSDRYLIELENQVQRLMEAHLAPKQPVRVNKITSSCEICSDPHDTQYCMENPKQVFVDYASSRNNEVGGRQRLSSLGPQLGRQQDDMINKNNILWKVFSEKLDDTSIRDTEDEVREEENVKPNATEYNDHEITAKAEEKAEEESKDEFEEEIE
ncbi:hypothetical protein Tco_1025660 [Tanacetum coccineum]